MKYLTCILESQYLEKSTICAQKNPNEKQIIDPVISNIPLYTSP